MAISSIASALQRKVRFIWGHEVIYPNLYVILVGPSGRARKGAAMSIAMDVVKDAGIVIAAEDVTREQLIRKMKSCIQTFTDPGSGKTQFHCSLTCFSEELSVFLGQNDVRFLATLTNWYDARDNWTYETKNQGVDHIQGVCFSLIGATAPDWIPSMLPQEAIGGGFTSRCIFVVEQGKGKTVEEHTITEEERALRGSLVADLEHIVNMSGEFRMDDETREAYRAWYRRADEEVAAGSPPIADPRFEGYIARRATHVRKLCMVMSASRSDSRKITKVDFERAVKTLEAAERNMASAFGGVGRSDYVAATEAVLGLLVQNKRMTRSQIMKILWRDLDSQSMRMVQEILEQMKAIRVVLQPDKGDVLYELIQ